MSKEKVKKSVGFERMYKIWEYLKRNTDSERPTTQAEMRKDSELSAIMGHKDTFNSLIKNMASVLNSDEYGYKPVEEWKIYFYDFKHYYDKLDPEIEENEPDDDDDKEDVMSNMHLRGLYYDRTFSYDEISSLIEGVLAAKTIDTKTANHLIWKREVKH